MDIKEEAAALYKAAVKIVEAEYAMMCSVHPASVRPVYRGIQCMDDLRETVFRLSCDSAWGCVSRVARAHVQRLDS